MVYQRKVQLKKDATRATAFCKIIFITKDTLIFSEGRVENGDSVYFELHRVNDEETLIELKR